MMDAAPLTISIGEDLSEEEFNLLVENHRKAQRAINSFYSGNCSVADLEGLLEWSGIDPIEYAEILENNLRILGA